MESLLIEISAGFLRVIYKLYREKIAGEVAAWNYILSGIKYTIKANLSGQA